jgi:M6 family metalloprotease-like protein
MLHSKSPEERDQAFRAALQQGTTTVRILVLRTDFLKDTPGSKTTGDGRFDLRTDAEGPGIDPPPHNRQYFDSQMHALKRYYDAVMNGHLRIEWDVYPAESDSAYHLPDTKRYGPWVFSNSNPDVYEHALDFVEDALAAADADPAIDFSRYQSVIIFHAGADFQGDINLDSPWDIPSFNVGAIDPFVVQDSTVAFGLVMVIPETLTQDGYLGAMNAVVAHEFGHQLGFFDLYDVTTGGAMVGAFSLMDSGTNLFASVVDTTTNPAQPDTLPVRGILPSGVDPLHKLIFFPDAGRWHSQEDYLAGDQDSFQVTLPAVEVANDILYLPLNQNEPVPSLGPWGEFYLIENRRLDLNGDAIPVLKRDPETHVVLGPDSSSAGDTLGLREYDYLLPGEGILVWHVDWNSILYGLSVAGGVNVLWGRPGIMIEEADGIRDIGAGSPEYLGGPYDPYFVGGYTRLGPDTKPNTDTNDGSPSGMSIAVLDSSKMEMRVSVRSRLLPPGWPATFLGAPDDEQVLAADVTGDGAPEILAAAQEVILAWGPDGTPLHGWNAGGRFAVLEGPIQGSLVEQDSFPIPGRSPGPVIGAIAQGVFRLLDAGGQSLARWPAPESLGVALHASLLDSTAVVGCEDGRVRVLALQEGGGFRVLAAPPVSSVAIRAVGAGSTATPGEAVVFWASSGGVCGAFTWSAAEGVRTLWRDSGEGSASAGNPRGILALDDPTAGMRYVLVWESGEVQARGGDGSLLEGWPVHLDSPMSGQPIFCDLDRDGVLETVLASEDGTLHVLGWNGVEKLGWPRSVWGEDETYRPVMTCGPRAWDVNGDGTTELLLHRSDGFLLALDAKGHNVPGWPLVSGRNTVSGPHWIPAGGGFGPRLAMCEESWLLGGQTAVNVVRMASAASAGPGLFPASGVTQARGRFYPAAWVPTPQPAPGDLAEDTVVLYPNPLRGDRLTVHFVLGAPARVALEAFDLSGQRKATLAVDGQAGAGGNQFSWDLSSLAPGLYHVRFRARGDGFNRELFRKLAIVR